VFGRHPTNARRCSVAMRNVTYEPLGRSWFVVSGYLGDQI
jgi:hypothetical protein